jgi:hypothetical protein
VRLKDGLIVFDGVPADEHRQAVTA